MIQNYIAFYDLIYAIFSSKQFFLCTEIIAFTVYSILGFLLIKTFYHSSPQPKKHTAPFYLLLLIVFCINVEKISWILKLSSQLNYIAISAMYIKYMIMIAWIGNLALFQSLGLFIENITENKFCFKWHQKLFLYLNSMMSLLFIYSSTCYLIYKVESIVSIHLIICCIAIYRPCMLIISMMITLQKMYPRKLPAILNQQIQIFFTYIIIPLLISDIIGILPMFLNENVQVDLAGLAAVVCSLSMVAVVIFCASYMVRFRFLNFFSKVSVITNIALTCDFKKVIEQTSSSRTPEELILITQNFFKDYFKVTTENICLHFRYKQPEQNIGMENNCTDISNAVEDFINKQDAAVRLLQEYKILVTDEIAFDFYYSQDPRQLELIQLLENIQSEIFVPLYDKNTIIAYVTIKKAHPHKFYSLAEQNQIVIFGTYLASTINIMHNSNTITLLHENKKVKDELYLKHQEINQYKESMKMLLKQRSDAQVGIIFYKEERFTIGNETAQKFLGINLHHQRYHPTTIALTKLAEEVSLYRTTQSRFLYDDNNKQLLVTGVPHLDYNGGAILTIHYPDTSDTIKTHMDKLHDPSRIDYLLYLESTKSGKLINQILPSNNEVILNFKIKLLEACLHKKAILLQSHDDDMLTIAEIIHHISLRQNLHIIDLKPTETQHNLSMKLFGINPLLMQEEDGVLKKLDQHGTLFIKNIDLLDLKTQEKLAQFIRYGIFTVTKSEQRVAADVRIICSVSNNPQTLIDQNKLSADLYTELSETCLQMPSLLTMDEKDLQDLIDGMTQQPTSSPQFSKLLQLSKKEKEQLFERRPASLQEFKSKIQTFIAQKAKENNVLHDTYVDPEFNITDPKLLHAARLGKHALKDPDMMSMLWKQLHCQSKIAQFLGVNRSSVQRRCREYDLS